MRTHGYIALFITLLIWGTTFMITKLVLAEMGPLLLTALRFLIAFLLLAPLAARRGFRLRQVSQPKYLLFGLTGTTLYYGLQNVGLTYTSVSSTVLILASVPALTTLLAVIFLGEHMSGWQVLGLGLVTVGVVLVGMDSSQNSAGSHPLLGNLLIFCGALAWAVYTIQGRKMSNNTPAIVMTAASTGAGALLLLPFVGWEILAQGLPQHVSLLNWLGILYLGLIGSGLTMYLWNYTLHYLPASVASSYINLVPVIGLGTAYLLGEQPPLIQIVGGGLAILGVLLSNRPVSKNGD